MTDGILIGIDAGTSVIKAIAFTAAGEQIASAAIANSYETLDNGGVEQDMARTWVDAAAALKQLTGKIPNLAARVIAIAVTGQGDGTWLIDANHQPVRPAILWLDGRSADFVRQGQQNGLSDELFRITGTALNLSLIHI